MLIQLSTLKRRLSIPDSDTASDALLTKAIQAVSARFDKETHRTLARTESFTQEFDSDSTEVVAVCYPVESITRFDLKTSEAQGWIEQAGVECLIRRSCIISLNQPLRPLASAVCPPQARVVYTGGFVLPGATPAPGQTPLPDDLEQAAVEQAACWFQNRDHLGLKTLWPYHGSYQQFLAQDLLPEVRVILTKHQRWAL